MRQSGLTESKSFIQCQLMNENKLLVHKHLIVRAESIPSTNGRGVS
jgi:hypothetical protein